MPPSTSHSPRRKRVRKFVSTSVLKWDGKTSSSSPVTHLRRRRSSSASSSGIFSSSHHHESRSDLGDLDHIEDSSSALSHAEPFPILPPPDRPPLTYASLPPTPITSSPGGPRPREPTPTRTAPPDKQAFDEHSSHVVREREPPPFSLWDYLREELLATDFDSHQELKWERVSNFLSMPIAIEKVRGILTASRYLDSKFP